MASRRSGPPRPPESDSNEDNARRIIAEARRAQAEREKGYREQSLKIHPWVCGRCGREFTRRNLHLLTVHHKDNNHDNNPTDGSNWENLCVYCHENEHRRYHDYLDGADAEVGNEEKGALTHSPFSGLRGLLKPGEKE